MKKRLLALILAVAVILPFAGCSCTTRSVLSFTNAWNGETTPTLSNFKKESLRYSVNFKADYADEGFDYSKSKELDKYVEYEFTDGVYTTELALYDKNNEIIENKDSDIIADESYKDGVFHIKSELRITAKYRQTGEADFTTYEDVVSQETFFCVSEKSFAPIYSHIYSKASVLTLDNAKAVASQSVMESKTLYNSKKAVVFYLQGSLAGTKRETDYSVMTVIDNAQLLFTLRGVKGLTKESSTVTLPVVSPAFGAPTDLSLKRYKDQNEPLTIIYNGATLSDLQIPVTKIGYRISSNTNFGKTQMVYMQTAKTGDLPSKNLIVKYYEPLTSYGSFLSMGVLEYTLTQVQVETPNA